MNELLDEARTLFGDLVRLRRAIHREPEIGLDLPRTQAKVLDALAGLPVEVRTGRQATSVVADLHGAQPGRTILLRADMDALPLQEDTGLEFASATPGRMHACGHDAHTAMLVGAARLLARRQSQLAGTVRFMFEPGEEGYFGARTMLDEGLLDGPARPTAAFALHASPRWAAGTVTTRPGPVLASDDWFTVLIHGRGGHASAPHLAADPVPVACEIAIALQTFITRSVSVFEPAVITVGKIEAGTINNVIPETAMLLGSVRTLAPATRTLVLDGLHRVARGISDAHGMAVSVEIEEGYPVTVNDAAFARFVIGVAQQLLGVEQAPEQATPQMAAEDFSYVLERVPGAMLSLGSRPKGMGEGEAPSPHSNRYLLEEEAMVTGAAMHAAVALAYLSAADGPS
jgi:amidohydrolase